MHVYDVQVQVSQRPRHGNPHAISDIFLEERRELRRRVCKYPFANPLISERSKNLAFQNQAASLRGIAKYAGRVSRQLFYATVVNPSFISSKAAAMAMHGYITGERLPRDARKARDYATRVAELALTRQDFDLVQDLRDLNGRVESPLFDAF